ncbi:hypothetical protein C5L14_23405 [Labrys okinawensis]|uniref:Uncharacterized protein n=1 Tax=Labrys okinawensis TaxID=346911 RepID=A0A2S9Q6C6_9HYPH|nr:hypothetical protein C5L14_23405 [Labrys okinawensis]
MNIVLIKTPVGKAVGALVAADRLGMPNREFVDHGKIARVFRHKVAPDEVDAAFISQGIKRRDPFENVVPEDRAHHLHEIDIAQSISLPLQQAGIGEMAIPGQRRLRDLEIVLIAA